MRLTEQQVGCLQRLAGHTAGDGWLRSSADGAHATVAGVTATSLLSRGLVERWQLPKADGGGTFYRITDAGRVELGKQTERMRDRAARTAGRLPRAVTR